MSDEPKWFSGYVKTHDLDHGQIGNQIEALEGEIDTLKQGFSHDIMERDQTIKLNVKADEETQEKLKELEGLIQTHKHDDLVEDFCVKFADLNETFDNMRNRLKEKLDTMVDQYLLCCKYCGKPFGGKFPKDK